jgi:uncharacterized protein with GYD domain
MALYIAQVAYNTEGWAALVRNPQDREAALRPMFAALGRRRTGSWLTFGEYDAVVRYELPDNVAAAALGIAVAAGGAVKAVKTAVLATCRNRREAIH